jgi:cell division GTPase FtsZ
MNESMADAVKITVIATGFQPQYAPAAEEPRAQQPQAFWTELAVGRGSASRARTGAGGQRRA